MNSEEQNNRLQKVEETYERIKQIQERRDEKINWMREKAKIKEQRMKKLEEVATLPSQRYQELKEKSRKAKEEEAIQRMKDIKLHDKEYKKVILERERNTPMFNSTTKLEMENLQKK